MTPRFVLVLALVFSASYGCTAVETVPSSREPEEAELKMEVEPASAEIHVDGQYVGEADGWKGGVVPLKPGKHRVKLEADGYMPRRFDVTLEPGGRQTLSVELERELKEFEEAREGASESRSGRAGFPADR